MSLHVLSGGQQGPPCVPHELTGTQVPWKQMVLGAVQAVPLRQQGPSRPPQALQTSLLQMRVPWQMLLQHGCDSFPQVTHTLCKHASVDELHMFPEQQFWSLPPQSLQIAPAQTRLSKKHLLFGWQHSCPWLPQASHLPEPPQMRLLELQVPPLQQGCVSPPQV